MKILTPDEVLAELAKPELKLADRTVLSDQDCLVVCAGFEERALAVLRSVSVEAKFSVLMIRYLPDISANKGGAITRICNERHLPCLEQVYDRQNPAGFGPVFVESISSIKGRIFLDISGMSRLLIVQLLVALFSREARFANCSIFYTEAVEYPPAREEAELAIEQSNQDPTFSILFLSSGVFDVTVIPELSSIASSGGQTRLVAFPSLDAEQLTALRAELHPSRHTFIEGVPPKAANKWRKDIIAKLNHLEDVADAEKCAASTLDYRETLNCLLDVYSRHGLKERLVLSPTGSKMQTVAVGIFRAFVSDVQIVYPTPRAFCSPERYTLGVGPIYTLQLDAFSDA